ncbi:hypothetical protein DFH06DRAFT_1344606 [Mycena polygramma]|nr:hypothetical protein DFH06DRAFT_1344606 [Mycena polygramma]
MSRVAFPLAIFCPSRRFPSLVRLLPSCDGGVHTDADIGGADMMRVGRGCYGCACTISDAGGHYVHYSLAGLL